MDTSTKGRSTERPPSPSASTARHRSRRRRIALGAAVVTTAVATAIGPAAADALTASDSAPAPRRAAVVRTTDDYPHVDPALARVAQRQADIDLVVYTKAANDHLRRERFERFMAWAEAREQAIAAREAERERQERPSGGPAAGPVAGGSVWDSLAACESGGNWAANTGNGYYGGLQFSLQTWQAYGGSGMPHENSREAQIAVAQRVQAGQGWGAWPGCSSKLGL